jgi:hypothetical protein
MRDAEWTSRAWRIGLGVCGALLLVACPQKERQINQGGGGTSGSTAGSGGTTQSSGTGGAPCTTTDPGCACVDGKVTAIDADGDGHGTLFCATAPGDDCDDTDQDFVADACGGCNKDLGAKPGDACNDCGTQTCQTDHTLACAGPSTPLRGCAGNVVQVCDATGKWQDETSCVAPTPACVAGACGSCTPGQQQCNDAVVQQCDGTGKWVDQTTCVAPTPVCLAATCVVCAPGAKQCSGTTTQVCNSQGAWVNQTTCGLTTPVCLNGACVVCNPGDVRCSNSTQPQTCGKAGSWINETACSGGLPYCMGGACKQCKPGTFKCGVIGGGPVSIPCSSTGSWSSTWTSCSLSCNASTGKCTLFHPLDLEFEVPRLLREHGVPADLAPARARRTQDVLDLAVGIAFG